MTQGNPHMPNVISSPIAFAVLKQAAEWFAVLRSDDVSETDRARWRDWLEGNPEHRSAWQRVESISGKFDSLPEEIAREVLDAAGRDRRRFLKTLTVLCITGTGAWAASQFTPWREWITDHQTAIGETRELILPDGTRIWLNTATAVNIDYSAGLRRIAVVAGELLIETSLDIVSPGRPFVVETAHGRLRPLGTRFGILQDKLASRVAVYNGAVEILPGAAGAPAQVLRAGQQTRFTRDVVDSPESVNEANPAWTRGILIADNMRLADLVAELSRYRRGYLACAPKVENLRVVGAFPLADTDRVLVALENTLPVKVRTLMPWWVTIEPR
jgi:transmembrane sensor